MAGSTYSWEDFLKELDGSGMRGQFSDADLKLAQANPDVGMSLLGYKRQYAGAATDEERSRINNAANALRSSYGGYTAGANGASFLKDPMAPRDFTYQDAPTYQNRYDERVQQLLDAVTNRPDFSYDAESDPLYSQYRKQYLREGKRAVEDTMGTASAMSGGLPTSYAATAAQQAGNYYNAQLTDKIPELEQLAYRKYLDDFDMDRTKLSAVQSAEQADYQKYLNQLDQYNADRSFAYGQYADELERQRYDEQTAYERDYQARRDAVADQRYADETAYQRRQDERSRALEEALTGAQYGDYSGLAGLGYDTSGYQSYEERQRALQDALTGAQYGDYSGLAGLGYDTSGYQSYEERQRALQEAQLYAQYGDYSKLRELGVDTSAYEAQRAAASAGSGRSYSGGGSGGSRSGDTGGNVSGEDSNGLLSLISGAKSRSEVFDIIYGATQDRLLANEYAENWEAENKKPEEYTSVFKRMQNNGITNRTDAVTSLMTDYGMSREDAESLADEYMSTVSASPVGKTDPTIMAGRITDYNMLGAAAKQMANSFASGNVSYDVAQRAGQIESAMKTGTITEQEADYLLRMLGL